MAETASAAGAADGRRGFFVRLFWALAGAIGALVGVPVVGAFLSPALRPREKAQWVAVGPVASFGPEPRLGHHVHPSQEGWVNVTAEMQVWVVERPGGRFVIFDNHCTHLGCPYHWDAAARRFICPCHNGQFDINGTVVGGPPPRPLDYYETKTEGGVLYMGAFHRGGT